MCNTEGSLVGKIAFFERIDKDGKPAYNGGERLVIRETPAVWYGVKLGGGYDSHDVHSFPKLGTEAWKVLSASDGLREAAALAADLEEFAKELYAPQKHWIDSVYTGAKEVARQIRAIIPTMTLPPEPITVHVKPGQTITLIVQS